MWLALLSLLVGLGLLLWSADRFVEGAAAVARHFSLPPLLIGMVIVGFGTSAPEIVVSSLAAWQGSTGIALGNAYGSNITNIALILGVTALLSPIAVQSGVLKKELPVLAAVTALAAWQLRDGSVSRLDAVGLLGVFALLMVWTIREGMQSRGASPVDPLGEEMQAELEAHAMPLKAAWWRVGLGLVLLVVSSRMLVWGAVEIAHAFGVSDLIIGLTVVAVGTSLPELASSIAAARKGEHDLALGNIIGSNLFNTLAVVGLAGVIRPLAAGPEVLTRDVVVMAALTVLLFVLGYGRRGAGRINRVEGGVLVGIYLGYVGLLVVTAAG
ncbi:unnamed protein product [Cyprideis torosa]|uniref:Sodium/calcium exchanger membrane region domain-containing protein n=1 Tax=Cyprideis torosa TaxID=163714 RepID=A0A7R8WNX7_9CRUS|nr:unnamed protein product [Cyprideis torosa]CAG0906724.1 unnamed protein product [Cyprideis torosa]